jgi:hypothetical protein
MKRGILDTNIYGRIIEKKEEEEIKKIAELNRDIVIYGFDVIRKELRNVPAKLRIENKLLRLMLLGFYDVLNKSHMYYTTSLIRHLADDYFEVYKQLGGKEKKTEILNDFLIVACASIHELDIVISEDNKTMLNQDALKAYGIANALKRIKTPSFIDYQKFRRLLA